MFSAAVFISILRNTQALNKNFKVLNIFFYKKNISNAILLRTDKPSFMHSYINNILFSTDY